MSSDFLTRRGHPWSRTAFEIVLGFVLLGPFASMLLHSSYVGHVLGLLSLPALLLWLPFFSNREEYIIWPHLFVTSCFLLHTVFVRERFPRARALARKVRPYVFALVIGYVLTGWSQAIPGKMVPWRSLAPYDGISERQTDSLDARSDLVEVRGFPLGFSIEDTSLTQSSATPYFLVGPLFLDVGVYTTILLFVYWHMRKQSEVITPSRHPREDVKP